MLSLSEPEKRALLRVARRAIETAVREERFVDALPAEGIFLEYHGVFVTLHCRGRLRGCIGVIEPEEALGESIVRCAVSAALEDPRFSSLQPGDLPGLSIEISLLTPPEPIAPEAIEIGRHGLLICHGSQRGLLLPQVAIEHHLTRERFLEETCRKAGLPADIWKDPTIEIRAFACEILSEAGLAPART